MGTTYRITCRPSTKLALGVDVLQAGIDSVLDRVNGQMSTYLRDSEISTFNDWRSRDPFPVSKEFAFVVSRALHWSQETDGAFDITVFPLLFLWGFGPGQERSSFSYSFPSAQEITGRLSHVGHGKLKVQEGVLTKKDPLLMLDLNAIAKGFGVDALFSYLRSLSISRMMVEIGGEVRAMGKNARGRPWAIAIERPPFFSSGGAWAYELDNAAMATSGDYRNFFEIDGKVFSHEIDPRTGYPAQTGVASATVVAPHCTDADALATALMVMGQQQGLRLVETLDGVEALLFLREGENGFRWTASSGFQIRER
ncbi:MAG: FAD:protein FMN transferase [Fidelibacterota bacterium]